MSTASRASACANMSASARREQIQEFRDPWIERAQGIADAIGLPYTVDVANDPFFGRVGTMMATQQRADALKFELLVPVRSAE